MNRAGLPEDVQLESCSQRRVTQCRCQAASASTAGRFAVGPRQSRAIPGVRPRVSDRYAGTTGSTTCEARSGER